MPTLDEWTSQVSAALGLPPEAVDPPRAGASASEPGSREQTWQSLVLELARDTAHGVARPAAPLTAYLAGVAVGRGLAPAEVAAIIRSLVPPAESV